MIENNRASFRITINPQVRSGQPIMQGTRITVSDIMGWLGGSLTETEILADHPEITAEDIQAALHFANPPSNVRPPR
jgi:uncharacterized protein (DUF433 family)